MCINEITNSTILEILITNGLIDEYVADMLYCDLLRDTADNLYAKRRQKIAEFYKDQFAASACLIDTWKALKTKDELMHHELMLHVIDLVSLHVYCTEDLDKDELKAYEGALRGVDLRKSKYDKTQIRSACINLSTRYKGKHSFVVFRSIKCCLAKLIDYIVADKVGSAGLPVSREIAIDTVADMLKALD